jgi:hypothetical protein
MALAHTISIRYVQDDARERQQFIDSLNIEWEMALALAVQAANSAG